MEAWYNGKLKQWLFPSKCLSRKCWLFVSHSALFARLFCLMLEARAANSFLTSRSTSQVVFPEAHVMPRLFTPTIAKHYEEFYKNNGVNFLKVRSWKLQGPQYRDQLSCKAYQLHSLPTISLWIWLRRVNLSTSSLPATVAELLECSFWMGVLSMQIWCVRSGATTDAHVYSGLSVVGSASSDNVCFLQVVIGVGAKPAASPFLEAGLLSEGGAIQVPLVSFEVSLESYWLCGVPTSSIVRLLCPYRWMAYLAQVCLASTLLETLHLFHWKYGASCLSTSGVYTSIAMMLYWCLLLHAIRDMVGLQG